MVSIKTTNRPKLFIMHANQNSTNLSPPVTDDTINTEKGLPFSVKTYKIQRFYRAMHFSAKRGIAIACRLSVRPSVCLSVCL